MKKRAAAEAAALVQPGQRLGLGTGSTSELFVRELALRWEAGELAGLRCVASSDRTTELALTLGLPLFSFHEVISLDLTVDGADEVDPKGNLLKGRGGALLREKVLAQASNRYIIVADSSKHVDRLGSRGPVPVEVLPFAVAPVMEQLRELGAGVRIRGGEKAPFMTDQNNLVLDCDFGPLADPHSLGLKLQAVAGILEHGLFLGFRPTILTGTALGVERQEPQ